jgi:hypothetical protein
MLVELANEQRWARLVRRVRQGHKP